MWRAGTENPTIADAPDAAPGSGGLAKWMSYINIDAAIGYIRLHMTIHCIRSFNRRFAVSGKPIWYWRAFRDRVGSTGPWTRMRHDDRYPASVRGKIIESSSGVRHIRA